MEWRCLEGHEWKAAFDHVRSGKWCPKCAGTQKLTLFDAQQMANKHGGVCLSEKYINTNTMMRWKCSEGHEWESKFSNVRAGKWCHVCGGSAKLTIEDMQKLALSRGGLCLSDKYINCQTSLKWQCDKGHIWNMRPMNIRNQKQWCPECWEERRGDSTRDTIEHMREIAQARGGYCLSTQYINCETKLHWRCSQMHQWWAIPHSVIYTGTWCLKCSGKEKKTIEDMRAIARSRGGDCLSDTYINISTKLAWLCSEGHEWEASPVNIIHDNTWCPNCNGNLRLAIEDMQDLALQRGGQCLSSVYVNQKSILRWECSEGHVWDSMAANIRNGGCWCPHCPYKNEDECRRIIERLTKKPFVKCRPDWLDGLELDGYCEQIEIAFEYNGEQHSRVIPAWHRRGDADLEAQQERDAVKEAACEDRGTDLIVIDFSVEDKLSHITEALCAIYRKRRAALMATRMARKGASPVFTIANTDRIWKELDL